MMFAVPLGRIWGNANFFDFSSKTNERYPLEVPYLKKNTKGKILKQKIILKSLID